MQFITSSRVGGLKIQHNLGGYGRNQMLLIVTKCLARRALGILCQGQRLSSKPLISTNQPYRGRYVLAVLPQL